MLNREKTSRIICKEAISWYNRKPYPLGNVAVDAGAVSEALVVQLDHRRVGCAHKQMGN